MDDQQWAGMHVSGEPYVDLVGIWWTGLDGSHYLALGGPDEYRIRHALVKGEHGPILATVTREELERLFR